MPTESLCDKIARSTLQILADNSRGSGFMFSDNQTAVTNFHVIESALATNHQIQVRNYINGTVNASVIMQNPQLDYAVLRLSSPQHDSVPPLEGEQIPILQRGTEVAFAGYPFGLDPLLVSPAWISAPYADLGFFISGSVNPGNSGGPVVNVASGKVIGIASAKRFFTSPEMQQLQAQQADLEAFLQSAIQQGSVRVFGLDINRFALATLYAFDAARKALEQNANSGIGIAYSIKHVMQALAAGPRVRPPNP